MGRETHTCDFIAWWILHLGDHRVRTSIVEPYEQALGHFWDV